MDILFTCGIVFTIFFSMLSVMTVFWIRKGQVPLKPGVILIIILVLVGPVVMVISGVQDAIFEDEVEIACQNIVNQINNPFNGSELTGIAYDISEAELINSERCKIKVLWYFSASDYGDNPGWSAMQWSLESYIRGNFPKNINGVAYSYGDVEHLVFLNGRDYNFVDQTEKKCAMSGCEAYAVTSGDSVYCEQHSERCLNCGCYIDYDAIFCMPCIEDAIKN